MLKSVDNGPFCVSNFTLNGLKMAKIDFQNLTNIHVKKVPKPPILADFALFCQKILFFHFRRICKYEYQFMLKSVDNGPICVSNPTLNGLKMTKIDFRNLDKIFVKKVPKPLFFVEFHSFLTSKLNINLRLFASLTTYLC